ncbi:hypothetical protein TNCV_4517931 [Trichonephila clavipes]|nr:hypothetical protein TNCV_4517931 [Trichonephila clavipes]
MKQEMQLFDSTENPSPNIIKLCDALKTIPPASVEAERAFSAAGLFVTKLRTRRRRREKGHLKHCVKGKLSSGFLIRKAFSKVGVCSGCRVMPRLRRNAYQKVSQYEKGRIVTYLECGLSFHEVVLVKIQPHASE